LDAERIGYFRAARAPVDAFGVGSAISAASAIDFTADIKEVDGRPVAKRGRIPGLTENPRLKPLEL
jgi:nicotinate phosphoribosyltransferase